MTVIDSRFSSPMSVPRFSFFDEENQTREERIDHINHYGLIQSISLSCDCEPVDARVGVQEKLEIL